MVGRPIILAVRFISTPTFSVRGGVITIVAFSTLRSFTRFYTFCTIRCGFLRGTFPATFRFLRTLTFTRMARSCWNLLIGATLFHGTPWLAGDSVGGGSLLVTTLVELAPAPNSRITR